MFTGIEIGKGGLHNDYDKKGKDYEQHKALHKYTKSSIPPSGQKPLAVKQKQTQATTTPEPLKGIQKINSQLNKANCGSK